MRFFLCLFYMFHRRYSNCRPLYSARYNRIICQTVENTPFLACSKRSDSGERCEVKKGMKSRGGLGREVPLPLPRFYFFALLLLRTAPHYLNAWDRLRHFLRGCRAYCTRWRKVTKVTNPISDFTFLSTAKSGKSRIKNPFLDSPKGTHPQFV